MWLGSRFLDTEVDYSNPVSISILFTRAKHIIRIGSDDTDAKCVQVGDTLVKGVQCNKLFGKNST